MRLTSNQYHLNQINQAGKKEKIVVVGGSERRTLLSIVNSVTILLIGAMVVGWCIGTILYFTFAALVSWIVGGVMSS